jgi:hypothetical protein
MRKLLAFVLICGLFTLGCTGTSPSSSPSKKGPTGDKTSVHETPPPKGETPPTETKMEKKTTEKKTEKKAEGN